MYIKVPNTEVVHIHEMKEPNISEGRKELYSFEIRPENDVSFHCTIAVIGYCEQK